MWWKIPKKSRTVCSVMITETAVTGMALARARTGYDVLACDSQSLTAESSHEVVITALRQVHNNVCPRQRKVVTAIKSSLTLQKQISLPGNLSPKAFDQAITSAYHRSFKQADLFVDHQILGKVPGKPEQIALRLIAARKTDVIKLESLFELAGLKLTAVNTIVCALESAAQEWLREHAIQGASNAIVVFQAKSLLFGIHNGHHFIYTREEHVDAGNFNSAAIVSLLKRCWQLFAAKAMHRQLQNIILVSEDDLPGAIATQLSDEFGCSSYVADAIPWVNIGLALGDYSS